MCSLGANKCSQSMTRLTESDVGRAYLALVLGLGRCTLESQFAVPAR